jgi:hypothetical protein
MLCKISYNTPRIIAAAFAADLKCESSMATKTRHQKNKSTEQVNDRCSTDWLHSEALSKRPFKMSALNKIWYYSLGQEISSKRLTYEAKL